MATKRAKNRRKKNGKFLNLLLLAASTGIFAAGIVALWAASLPLPDFDSFEQRKIAESTKIYDRTGEVVLFDIHKDIKRRVVSFEDMSIHIKNATVAIEDSEFYEHKGVKPTAIVRAFLSNLLSGETRGQGGSTITQQVIKNTLLSQEKKYSRKIKEAALALKLERVMSKEEILALYLNESPYGGNIYGVEEASLSFFGKQSKDLNLAEAAYLAALPQAPTYYSPYGSNTDKLEARKNLVLDRMVELKFITADEAKKAKDVEVVFNAPEDSGIRAPHFVMYIKEYLERQYGRDTVETRGLKITSTLDWNFQSKAEEVVAQYAEENATNYNANNAGVVGIDPKTGQILVMVGSKDYFDIENNGNFNVTTGHRQPGSAFKPFVYATSFMKGYTPETVLFDLETQFSTKCDTEGKPIGNYKVEDCYSPKNYDNVFRGPVSIREALAQSINLPAVKTLYLTGLKDSLETARAMGISSLGNQNLYGLTLVLGGGEVSLLELTNAYSVFAAEGKFNPHTAILKIEDKNGDVLEEFEPKTKNVLDKNISLQITDILSDNDARAPAFGYVSPLYIPGRDVAAKTGTTNDYRDAWIVGYSPNIALGAWAGNNDNTSMEKKVAGFVVAPMWNAVIKEILNELPDEKFNKPTTNTSNKNLKPVLRGVWEGSYVYYIDSVSGKLATEYTPNETKEERFLNQTHSILYWVDKNNPRGDIPKNPHEDSQFNLWESGVIKWAEEKNIEQETLEDIPKETDDIHTPESIPKINIVSPQENQNYSPSTRLTVEVDILENKHPISEVDFFFNNTFVGSSVREPYKISFSPNEFGVDNKQVTIEVRVYDAVRNSVKDEISINISSI